MPAKEPKNHEHSMNRGQLVYGYRLGGGDVIEATDVYSSSNGKWEAAPCPGVKLSEGMELSDIAVWVRPVTDEKEEPFDADEIVV